MISKEKDLKEKIDWYIERINEMQKNWSATKAGSRYGDEYLEMQIKVYTAQLACLQEQLAELKQRSPTGQFS
ncbi:hypothetical protein KKD61_05240 [Patescibacteria group bacterium]|nr:hypothetical protein [Patescibacteria group bacterium]